MTTATGSRKPADRHKRSARHVTAAVFLTLAGVAASPALAQTGSAAPTDSGECGAALETAMEGHTNTRVVLAKAFRRGEKLVLTDDPNAVSSPNAVEGAAKVAPPVAGADLCLVKLVVGPGHPGPADAPSTSAGIGIEILLPAPGVWNERIRAYGNSGWSGTPQADPLVVASDDIHSAAVAKGFVVATSDNGHVGSPVDASFAMKPDGSINTVLWQDFAERSLHETAEKTKAVVRAYYGRPHRFAYWDGFSTGGRQGLKLAQRFPDDFDGILTGAPAINWTSYHTGVLYGPVAMQQDLGQMIAPEKLAAVSRASIAACGGAELGFVLDPLSCRYDPSTDAAILCAGSDNGTDGLAARGTEPCLTQAEANGVNKLWYGQTRDGSVPAPARDNGNDSTLDGGPRLWFGWTRGTELQTTSAGAAPGLDLAAGQTALNLEDASLATPGFRNATGDGMNRWRDKLNYAGLARSRAQGIALQKQFSAINTDDPDLSAFSASGGKLLMYHGLADEYIPVQGSINYYQRVTARMQGVSDFYRFYLVPGFTHSGRSEGAPFVPVPQPASGRDEMFAALQAWVEQDGAPGTLQLTSGDGSTSLPLCVFPQKLTYRGTGPAKAASSYTCS
ncbi:tannase/feruloyl esterase family alpha/beta hydrolase [Mycolicibacterium mengxianglii]|uniref:tannase/feruloyl esterase family alpha/beta hydrolase n=1 Tax=Mycolicibacterium mengxianglii TaxID=2736649 RepID=UPI0018D0E5A5|nr:tannase/feruloyl esterase family alpha/beta hydrolase [Mycolicibacterium mengxianglii]